MGRGGDVCHTAGGKEKEKKKQNGRKTQEQEGPSIDKSSKNTLRTIIFKEGAVIRRTSIGGARCCADGMEVRPYLDGSGCERDSFLSGFVCLHNSVYIIIWHKWRKRKICRKSLALFAFLAYSIDVFF